MLTARVLNSINEIDEQAWDSIVEKDHIISSHRFLKAVEESGINVCFYKYIVVDDGDKPAAHTCVYKMHFELDVLARGMVKRIANRVRSFWPGFLRLAFLECGTPVALGNTISYAAGVDRKKTIKLLVSKMEEIAKKNRIGIILLRDFYAEECACYDNLKVYNFTRLKNLPNTLLEIKWNSFEEYCNKLKSHYKCKIKHNTKQAEVNGIKFEILSNFSYSSDSLYQLWENTFNNAKEYRRERLTPQFFKNMAQSLPEQTAVIAGRKNNEIVCFGFVLVDDYTLRLVFSGIDYHYNKLGAAYFNILYEVIKLGIHTGKRVIDMGITTYFPKTDLGATTVGLYIYMKHVTPFLNCVIPMLFRTLTPEIQLGNKNVFK